MKRALALVSLALATIGALAPMVGCSPPGAAPVAKTTDQRIDLVNKVPMSPGQKQKLIEQIRSGRLK
jgi:hypothetical protein